MPEQVEKKLPPKMSNSASRKTDILSAHTIPTKTNTNNLITLEEDVLTPPTMKSPPNINNLITLRVTFKHHPAGKSFH